MSKKLLAVVLAGMFFSAGSAMAADTDGGQINIGGYVTSETCKLSVNGNDKNDYSVMLATIGASKVAGYDLDTTPKGDAAQGEIKDIQIEVTCDTSNAGTAAGIKLPMSFYSTFNNTNRGTLKNMSSGNAAQGVEIALHHKLETGNAYNTQVKVDGSTTYTATLDSDGKGVWLYQASYVTDGLGTTVKSGKVETNTTYTIAYN